MTVIDEAGSAVTRALVQMYASMAGSMSKSLMEEEVSGESIAGAISFADSSVHRAFRHVGLDLESHLPLSF